MNNYFKRQIQLWGEDVQKSLQEKNILIIGCGGLGSSLGIALGSSGIGNITLIDFDKIEISNIHRQIAFSINDEKNYKCETLAKLISNRYENINIKTYISKFEDFKTDEKYDLILDATDNLLTRNSIDKFAKQTYTPWIYASVEKFHSQICFFDEAIFEDVMQIKQRVPDGIACPMVMQTASIQANIAIRYLTGYKIKKDYLHYIYFQEDGDFVIKKFKILS